jgi:general secretion pathway protein G
MQSLLKRVHNVSRNEKGFTLVELIVVVAIIAILTAVLLPKLLGYTDSARFSRAKGDLASMKSVVEAYAADQGNGVYPTASNDATTDGTIAKVLQDKGIKWTGDTTGVKDPWGYPYHYGKYTEDSTGKVHYIIVSYGKDNKPNTIYSCNIISKLPT